MGEEKNSTELLFKLNDMGRAFTKGELEEIINEQFFNDSMVLYVDVVDAALMRLLALEGQEPSMENLQVHREAMMRHIMKHILIPKN